MTETIDVDQRAREANDPALWDDLWTKEGQDSWRGRALASVYERIEELVPEDASVVDVGGGVGILAGRLTVACGATVTVRDHSMAALKQAQEAGFITHRIDLEEPDIAVPRRPGYTLVSCGVVVCTEVLEHLSEKARDRFLVRARDAAPRAVFSVPHDRLGPEVEPQHTIQFTAMSFLRLLRKHYPHCRVEVMGPFLLGVCGDVAEKDFRLSVTMPVRQEARDLGKTLASFRGVADEIVIGVDPRSTDDTWEVALKYADVVFELNEPRGPVDGGSLERMADNGVNFGWVRNQCIERCSGQYIFMSEGHEHLATGFPTVLQLKRAMGTARVALVTRQGSGQQWAFPWIFRNAKDIRFTRATHNVLTYPDNTQLVNLVSVRTIHDRVHAQTEQRAEQRRGQNRRSLMDDWLQRQSEASLFYLAQEWREFDPARAKDRFLEFLATSNNGVQKYQARLILGKQIWIEGDAKLAREILMGCTADDWSRTEHFMWLGDMAFLGERWEEAYQFYRYSATRIGSVPFTTWWIDMNAYSHLPAQRLAMVCGELGRVSESCAWARKVRLLLPEDSPAAAFEEADANIKLLEQAMEARDAGQRQKDH